METVVSSSTNSVVTNSNTSNNIVFSNSTTEYVSHSLVSPILIETNTTNILITGLVGPAGPTAINEEDTMYSKRIDFINDNEFYRGEAVVGAPESSPVWRIRYITVHNNDISELWAEGTANFDKIWANRQALSYS